MVKTMSLALGAAILLTAGCSADTVASDRPSATGSSPVEPTITDECDALIPDEVFTELGWTTDDAAAEDAGRCLRRAEGSGAMTVVTRAVTAEGSDAARAGLEVECDKLRDKGGYVDQPVAWLEPSSDDSCFADLADTRTGVAELYFVNSVDELVQVRLEALTPLEPEVLQDAMGDVATAASELGS